MVINGYEHSPEGVVRPPSLHSTALNTLVSLIAVPISWIPALNRDPGSQGAIFRLAKPPTARVATVPSHRQHPSSSVAFSSATQVCSKMASQGQKNWGLLEQYLTPALLQGLREFWYEHLENEEDFIMPTADHSRRWYMGGKELDNMCL